MSLYAPEIHRKNNLRLARDNFLVSPFNRLDTTFERSAAGTPSGNPPTAFGNAALTEPASRKKTGNGLL